jgi:hypothetical protein
MLLNNILTGLFLASIILPLLPWNDSLVPIIVPFSLMVTLLLYRKAKHLFPFTVV